MLTGKELKEMASLYKTPEGLKRLAEMHWKKYRPKMFQSLKESGRLEESLNQAANDTWQAMQSIKTKLIEQGYTEQQAEDTAWEMMRQEWILLPEENEESEESGKDFMELMSMEKPPREIIE